MPPKARLGRQTLFYSLRMRYPRESRGNPLRPDSDAAGTPWSASIAGTAQTRLRSLPIWGLIAILMLQRSPPPHESSNRFAESRSFRDPIVAGLARIQPNLNSPAEFSRGKTSKTVVRHLGIGCQQDHACPNTRPLFASFAQPSPSRLPYGRATSGSAAFQPACNAAWSRATSFECWGRAATLTVSPGSDR